MENIKKHSIIVFNFTVVAFLFLCPMVQSHCEIPCGIYNDSMRISMMVEHIQTIEKSMQQIHELTKEKDKNYNQLVRWISNKESHADQLSEIVTQYFMKQRIAPVEKSAGQAYDDYIKKLTLLHQLMVYSMKCKQTTDLDQVSKLKETLSQFETAYMNPQTSSAQHDHSHKTD